MKALGYGEKWSIGRRVIHKPFDEAEARRRYETRREPFAVALGQGRIERVVEFVPGSVSVQFVDELGRSSLLYDFKVMNGSQLFLDQAIHSVYASPTDSEGSEVHHFSFKPDGTYWATRHDKKTGVLTKKEGVADPSPNWAEYPAFGQYDALLNAERLNAPPNDNSRRDDETASAGPPKKRPKPSGNNAWWLAVLLAGLASPRPARALLRVDTVGTGGLFSSSFDVTATVYDSSDALTLVKRAAGTSDEAIRQYAHGPRGLLVSTTEPTGGTFTYGWDGLGRLTSITPPPGSAVAPETYGYDFKDRLSRKTRGTSVWDMPWQDGARSSKAPQSGVTQTVFDGRGREAFVQYQPMELDAPTELTARAFSYDGWDSLVRLDEKRNDGDVSTAFLFDTSHLLQSVTRGSDVVSYGYAPPSRERRSVTAAGTSATYQYDSFDRVHAVTDAHGTTQVAFEAGGARLLRLQDARVTETNCYDERGRLSQVVTAPSPFTCGDMLPSNALAAVAYAYDERGNRTAQQRTGANSSDSKTLGYDVADRLTSETRGDGSGLQWALHPDGTRHLETRYGPGGVAQQALGYVYDGQGALTQLKDMSTQSPFASFVVDASGRRRGETRGSLSKTFGFDTAGRMVDATVTGLPDGVRQLHLRYDGLGQRRQEELTLTPPTGPPETSARAWAYGGESGEELASETLGGSPQQYVEAAGLPLSQGNVRFGHDGLGSVVAREDNGVASVTRYSAAGEFEAGAPTAAQASIAFAGGHHDAQLGLALHGLRWLDTSTNVWLSEDEVPGALDFPSGLGPFGYANLAPTRDVDVDGRYAGACQGLEPSAFNQCMRSVLAGGLPFDEETHREQFTDDARFQRQWQRAMDPNAVPVAGDALALRRAKEAQLSAVELESAIQQTDQAARFYLEDVALPYLGAEAAFGLVGRGLGMVGRGLARDLELTSTATARVEVQLQRIEARDALAETVAESRMVGAERSFARRGLDQQLKTSQRALADEQMHGVAEYYAAAYGPGEFAGMGVELEATYGAEGAAHATYSPYAVRVDPVSGRGPMAIDSSTFTSGEPTLGGGIRNPRQFWKAWASKYGDTLSPANKALIGRNRSPTVDLHWIEHFPEHADFEGQGLIHHHLDYGRQAIPLPDPVHSLQPGWGIWHVDHAGGG